MFGPLRLIWTSLVWGLGSRVEGLGAYYVQEPDICYLGRFARDHTSGFDVAEVSTRPKG